MEFFGTNRSDSLLSSIPHHLQDEINSAGDSIKRRTSQTIADVEQFVHDHKTGIAVAAGAAAFIGALAFRGRLGTITEGLLPDASKIWSESKITHDAAKLEKLTQQAASSDWRNRYLTACSWESPPELLASMSEDPHVQVRMMIAKHPLTPRATLRKMIANDVPGVGEAAQFGLERRANMQLVFARDPRASTDILHRLATEPSQTTKIREAIALHRKTAPQTLEFLARDAHQDVRTVVALHEATPPKALSELSRDRSFYVREAAAGNSALPTKELARLARDEFPGPRFEVASRSAASADLLQALARDKNFVVRSGVGANLNAPASVIDSLSHDGEPVVREIVARNPNASRSVLDRLSDDESGLVRISAKKSLRTRA